MKYQTINIMLVKSANKEIVMRPLDKFCGLSLNEIKQHIKYDAKNGCFYRKQTNNQHKVGEIAGNKRKNGYVILKVCGVNILAHRLVWLFEYGEWPKECLDHIDGDKSNNKIKNLREATYAQNKCNSKVRKDNELGLKGVNFDKKLKRYRARIFYNGKNLSLGSYNTKEEAHAVYVAKAKEIQKEFMKAT